VCDVKSYLLHALMLGWDAALALFLYKYDGGMGMQTNRTRRRPIQIQKWAPATVVAFPFILLRPFIIHFLALFCF
jgi:hypothetical protein